jgi:hypothetical protein
VEDDHVDRPGVEVRQRMKLTGTNSSIGLIVLIDQCSSSMSHDRSTERSRRVQNEAPPRQLLNRCASLTWWLWRGGRTRSLSEHGRETPLRPWYFVLRRGRVGRCQVCETQHAMPKKGDTPSKRHANTSSRHKIGHGRNQRPPQSGLYAIITSLPGPSPDAD